MNEELQGELSVTKIKSLLAEQQNVSICWALQLPGGKICNVLVLFDLFGTHQISNINWNIILFCNTTLRIEPSLIQPYLYDSIIQA